MRPVPVDLLAEVFATFARMDRSTALRRAETAIETLSATRDRSDLLALGLALHALELGPLHRFSGAPQVARERALYGWATSAVPQLRTAFQALKGLALFLAYADPGPDPAAPSNEAWPAMSYRPPTPLDEPAQALIRPIVVPRDRGSTLELEADVVIVGSGAGGGVIAARLAEAGRDVLVVEAGLHRLEDDMPSTETDAWRDMFLDRGAMATDDLGVTLLAGATLGGGTTVNWTTTIRPPDWVRHEWASEHGLEGVDAAEMDTDLERLEAELELLPPAIVPPKDRLILDGATALGWEADVTRRNAGPCTECGRCTFGCPSGAKRSGLRAHLAVAAASGARVLTDARVTRVLRRSGAATGIVGRLGPSGRPFLVRAPQVVVAAGSLRTPVILERSGLTHPAIGRHLRLHPAVVLAAELDDAVRMWEGPLQAARSLQFAGRDGFVIEAAPPHPGLAMAALPWTGRDDAMALAGRLDRLAPMIGIIRDRGAGRVRAAGRGRARVSYRLHPADAATARRALVAMARLAHAGGAADLMAVATPPPRWRRGQDLDRFVAELGVVDTSPNRISLFSAHQLGSARAGLDPRTSATDPGGRVRLDGRGATLRGAYVGDGSLVPSAPGVNPMLTIMAFAERTARAVLRDRGDRR